MVLPTEWFNVLKRYDVAATKLPPTQICNLKFSATHRNTIPFNFFFSLFFYNSNRGVDSRWNNIIYINGGDQQLEEQKKHKVTVPIKLAIGFFCGFLVGCRT
jgi:hypothetical protein